MTQIIADGKGVRPGIHFLSEAVDPIHFMSELKKAGVEQIESLKIGEGQAFATAQLRRP